MHTDLNSFSMRRESTTIFTRENPKRYCYSYFPYNIPIRILSIFQVLVGRYEKGSDGGIYDNELC